MTAIYTERDVESATATTDIGAREARVARTAWRAYPRRGTHTHDTCDGLCAPCAQPCVAPHTHTHTHAYTRCTDPSEMQCMLLATPTARPARTESDSLSCLHATHTHSLHSTHSRAHTGTSTAFSKHARRGTKTMKRVERNLQTRPRTRQDPPPGGPRAQTARSRTRA